MRRCCCPTRSAASIPSSELHRRALFTLWKDFPKSTVHAKRWKWSRVDERARVEIYSSGFQILAEITEMNRKRGRLVDYQ